MLRKLKYILFLGTLLLGTAALAAPYPLEITQPQPNLNTMSRFYKAYPGLEYNVRPAVFGGAYPFTHTLIKAPVGMTINARTGEITWPNPTTAGSPHAVTLKVTDSEGAVDTVSWTITVTTQGFGFVDAVNGKTVAQGGTGTITNPWRTLNDFYKGSVSDATYQGWFLYFRTGTYNQTGLVIDTGPVHKIDMSNKPHVWMAYPGESPAFEMTQGSYEWTADDVWVSGIRFQNIGDGVWASRAITVWGNRHRAMFYKNYFYRLVSSPDSQNQSAIMRTQDLTNSGYYMAILDNTFEDFAKGKLTSSYSQQKVVVEGNTTKNFKSGSHGIGPKRDNKYWSIRANNLLEHGDGGEGAIWLYNADTTHNIEVCYNLIKVTSGNTIIVGQKPVAWGPMHIYRNTFIGRVQVNNLDVATGPVRFSNNVIVNSDTTANHIRLNYPTSYNGPKLVLQNNLTGFPVDNIVNANGNLTAAYSEYLGVRGHYIGTQSAPSPTPVVASPSPPVLMEVR